MTMPRRRLVRPQNRPDNTRRRQRLRERLELERIALARWQSRLRRAFNAVEKHQAYIGRLERQITKLEGT
jgi:hypothetical protein